MERDRVVTFEVVVLNPAAEPTLSLLTGRLKVRTFTEYAGSTLRPAAGGGPAASPRSRLRKRRDSTSPLLTVWGLKTLSYQLAEVPESTKRRFSRSLPLRLAPTPAYLGQPWPVPVLHALFPDPIPAAQVRHTRYNPLPKSGQCISRNPIVPVLTALRPTAYAYCACVLILPSFRGSGKAPLFTYARLPAYRT